MGWGCCILLVRKNTLLGGGAFPADVPGFSVGSRRTGGAPWFRLFYGKPRERALERENKHKGFCGVMLLRRKRCKN
uniref:Secreted protein n=1 Tax=Setaria digitata TaxID=48799 RepID=A0A915PGM0_9BILA